MLFDLRGRRRRAVQATYLMLAVLMGGGLVLFGIGGDVSGGLFDAFSERGGGGNGNARSRSASTAREAGGGEPGEHGRASGAGARLLRARHDPAGRGHRRVPRRGQGRAAQRRGVLAALRRGGGGRARPHARAVALRVYDPERSTSRRRRKARPRSSPRPRTTSAPTSSWSATPRWLGTRAPPTSPHRRRWTSRPRASGRQVKQQAEQLKKPRAAAAGPLTYALRLASAPAQDNPQGEA